MGSHMRHRWLTCPFGAKNLFASPKSWQINICCDLGSCSIVCVGSLERTLFTFHFSTENNHFLGDELIVMMS